MPERVIQQRSNHSYGWWNVEDPSNRDRLHAEDDKEKRYKICIADRTHDLQSGSFAKHGGAQRLSSAATEGRLPE